MVHDEQLSAPAIDGYTCGPLCAVVGWKRIRRFEPARRAECE